MAAAVEETLEEALQAGLVGTSHRCARHTSLARHESRA
jgi:hypothetical protein